MQASRMLGIDRAVFYALMWKVWGMAGGLVTTFLVATHFSLDLQGYYYTFSSVLALQVFAELGLSVVISAHASHEWAKLAFDSSGRLTGDPIAMSRLASLGRFALLWYLLAGALVAVALAVSGFLFFASTNWEQAPLWAAPWIALCVATGANLCLAPVWALLEGCNQVSSLYGYRLLQSIAASTAAWLGIYAGAGLWVLAVVALVTALMTLATVTRRYASFLKAVMLTSPEGSRLNWRTDILPMQWRVSLSWLSGYFTFSLFTPVLFHYQGAVIAAQTGMTWAFITALTGVASSWISPKAPAFGMLIARQQYAELDRRFWQLTAAVVAITLAGAAAIWTGIRILEHMHHPFALRLLPSVTTGYLLLATVFLTASMPMSMYLRAHKKEPLLLISMSMGLATAGVVLVFGRYGSVNSVATGYLAVMVLALPCVALTWQSRRTQWHASIAA